MSRLPKPDFLVQYEQWVSAGPPECCHTCDHYSGEGRCFVFNMMVPAEFVNSFGQCEKYEQEIPF